MMIEKTDTSLLVARLQHSLTAIQTMLQMERQEAERQREDYLAALRRKAAGEQSGNVTAEFFGTGTASLN